MDQTVMVKMSPSEIDYSIKNVEEVGKDSTDSCVFCGEESFIRVRWDIHTSYYCEKHGRLEVEQYSMSRLESFL